jgi:hypothetical protein
MSLPAIIPETKSVADINNKNNSEYIQLFEKSNRAPKTGGPKAAIK